MKPEISQKRMMSVGGSWAYAHKVLIAQGQHPIDAITQVILNTLIAYKADTEWWDALIEKMCGNNPSYMKQVSEAEQVMARMRSPNSDDDLEASRWDD